MQIYKFSSGEISPEWLYRVADIPSGELAVTRFGVDGFVCVDGNRVSVVPVDGRNPEAFVFNTEGFWGNARVGHAKGDDLLKVFPDESSARRVINLPASMGSALVPASDPRV